MIQGITHIDWEDITEAVPAFLTIVFMPFTYSIADGIAMGFISYALIKLCTGKASTVPYMVWIIAVLWVLEICVVWRLILRAQNKGVNSVCTLFIFKEE